MEGKQYQATGKIQSIQWISILIAGLFTGIGGAFIAEKWDYRWVFYVCPDLSVNRHAGVFYKRIRVRKNMLLFYDLKNFLAIKKY